jgi:hypothetical protein
MAKDKGGVVTFNEMISQAVIMIQQHGRVSYRALKREFDLGDGALEDLKSSLVFAYPALRDEGQQGLVWHHDIPELQAPKLQASEQPRFDAVCSAVVSMLRCEGRVTYQTLARTFAISDAFLNALRDELIFKHVARDEAHVGLAWAGGGPTPAARQPVTPERGGAAHMRLCWLMQREQEA